MPPEPAARPDLFALEASEALQRLGRLLGTPDPPGEEAIRAARVLRGASLLGGPPDFTRAAAALEAAVKATQDGTSPWGPRVAEVLRGAVEGLVGLLQHARTWASSHAESAVRIAAEIERAAGHPGDRNPRPFGRRTSDRHEPGVRAFLAREATLVAGAVERLARDSALDNPHAIRNVLATTQPLRGVAFLGEVPPLGEVLEIIERVLTAASDGTPQPPRTREALSQLAGALTRAARDLAATGTPDLAAPELHGAARLIRAILADESDIVSIEGLFAPGDPTPIIHRGSTPTRELPGPDAALALHALAGRLAQGADILERTTNPALAALQETALLLQLREGLPPRPTLPTDRLLASLVRALSRGAAESEPGTLVNALRQASAALQGQADGGATAPGPSLAAVTAAIESLPGRDDPAPRQPTPLAAPAEELPVVPIETLLAAPPSHAGYDLLESSLLEYESLLAGAARPSPMPALVASTPLPDQVVPIESLLYRGRRALERAAQVRAEIDATLAAIRAERRLEPLLRELMDLVPLALDDAR